MKIGILQTGRVPEMLVDDHGDYDHMFEKMLAGRGFEFETWKVLDGVFPESVSEADGWLITGSRFGTYEGHDWIAPLEQFIRDIKAADLPLIGVCFGHQIIAQALGGKVEKYSGGWSVGQVDYTLNDGSNLPLHAWHQDQVVEKPPQARNLGSTDFCEHAVLAYGDKILTMQPHPEFSEEYMRGLIDKRGKGVVPDDQLEQAIQALGPEPAQAQVADMFEAVLKQRKTND